MTRASLPVVMKEVSWSVNHQPILRNLSLEIAPGESLALLGPSGCGKSTLLKLLAGLLQPETGEIWMGERCVGSPRHALPPEARQLGMVFQDYALWPHMTVDENVAFPLRMRGVGKAERQQRVRDMLARVGLSDFGKRKPSALSGGQQQRVALARALVAEPAILLFDEPLSNLDRDLRENLMYSMKALLRQTGITAVYVTHDRDEAQVIADRIIHLAQGQISSITHRSGEYHAFSEVR